MVLRGDSMTDSQTAAIAAEHFVAHKIAMLGLMPAVLRERVAGIDLLVASEKGERTIGVQVRAAFNAMHETHEADGSGGFLLRFPLGQRAIAGSAQAAIFCFVDLRQQTATSVPDVYVVPAIVLKKEY